MADLIRTIEADLFGAYEWAAEFYEELAEVPETPDRLSVLRGLFRAYDALEGKAEDAMRAAEAMVVAEDELDDVERSVVSRLDATRDALLAEPTAEHARAFLAVFDEVWDGANKQALGVADAILAALAHSNVIAATRNKEISAEESKAHHAKAAQLYEEINAMLTFRIGTGSAAWRETSQSALYRAGVAWRFAGEPDRSRRAMEIAGTPPGFERRGSS